MGVLVHFQPSKKPKVDEVQELLSLYQPPDWLTCTVNRISPYVPQLGDEVRRLDPCSLSIMIPHFV